MKVLIACEESQTETKAFRERGHEAYSCDIQPCSGGKPEWHIKGDVLPIIRGNMVFYTQDGKIHDISSRWDLIIAHPPCTYLSNAGACRLYPKAGEMDKDRYIKGLEGKAFFMAFWWYGFYGGRIVIENPVPSKVYNLPPPTNCVEPYFFGDPYTKKTYLWEFGVPPLMPTLVVDGATPYLPSGTGKKRGGVYLGASGHSSKSRSKAFPGMAAAMAAQWGTP